MKVVTALVVAGVLACASFGAAEASAQAHGPSGTQARHDLRFVLDAFVEGVRVDAFGQVIASDISDAGGPPVANVDYRSQARRRGVVYVVDMMPRKGLLYLVERDRRGRMHYLFVDALGEITER